MGDAVSNEWNRGIHIGSFISAEQRLRRAHPLLKVPQTIQSACGFVDGATTSSRQREGLVVQKVDTEANDSEEESMSEYELEETEKWRISRKQRDWGRWRNLSKQRKLRPGTLQTEGQGEERLNKICVGS